VNISNYQKGKYSAKPETVSKLARALSVNEAWLSGFDVDMEREAGQLGDRKKEFLGLIGEMSQDQQDETIDFIKKYIIKK